MDFHYFSDEILEWNQKPYYKYISIVLNFVKIKKVSAQKLKIELELKRIVCWLLTWQNLP
jgi:hypothetical protein